jgi:F-type H+-transporting ATPase subunit gamma
MKAIRVIKKITHAMRLISMSAHTKLRKNISNLELIKNEITPILCQLYTSHPEAYEMNQHARYENLYIVIGSEKGLCGNFNNILCSFLGQQLTAQEIKNSHFIVVGKKAKHYFEQNNIPVLVSFDKIQTSKVEEIASALFDFIESKYSDYKSIACIYNNPKTFFTVEAIKKVLIPVQPESCELNPRSLDSYVWIQPEPAVASILFKTLLKTNIYTLLTQSMIAEQSSRFLSMDSSTRNADHLLKAMNLEYNKIRQARITREIIELIGSF